MVGVWLVEFARFYPRLLLWYGADLRITGVLTASTLIGAWVWALVQPREWAANDVIGGGLVFMITTMLAFLIAGWVRARFGAVRSDRPEAKRPDGSPVDLYHVHRSLDAFVFFLNWIVVLIVIGSGVIVGLGELYLSWA